MVSPEMLPTHLRDIKNRLISSPKWVKHDRMILDQAAAMLDDGLRQTCQQCNNPLLKGIHICGRDWRK